MEWLKEIPLLSHLLLAENAGMTFWEALPILQNGILACLLTALMGAFLGVYVIIKRIVFVSAALSQVSALGVAFAFLAGALLGLDLGEGVHHAMPLLFSGLAAGFLAVQTSEKKITREGLLGIGYILPAGLVLLILDKIAGETHEIDNILFGNTIFVPTWQLFLLLLTAMIVLTVHLLFYKEFIFVAFDPDSARAAGLRTVFLNQIFFLTIAITISVSIGAVGALPVFGFMVIPGAAALMLADRLKVAFFLSIAFGILSALVGFYLSFLYSLPTGPAMLGTSALFLIPGVIRSGWGRGLLLVGGLTLGVTGSPASAERLNVVTTVAPITNIVLNIGGDRIHLHGIVPEGTDSHTFEPAPSDIQVIARADLLIFNGLNLEVPTEKLAHANKKRGAKILKLGDNTISKKDWVFDFSFPESEGNPNPHLWLNVAYAMRYAELVRDALISLDSQNREYYEGRAREYLSRLKQLDEIVAKTMESIPPENRKLVTYHDSWAYFCPRYGCKVIGAIQPSTFSEPSPKEMARLIDQLKAEKVPAIFGSEVFPSKILNQIGKEAGVKFISTLRDDDLPGQPGAPEHTYIGMMLENLRTMAHSLGGNLDPLEGVDPGNTK